MISRLGLLLLLLLFSFLRFVILHQVISWARKQHHDWFMKKPSTNADNCRKHRHRLAVEDPLLEQCKAPTMEELLILVVVAILSKLWAFCCFAQRLAMWKLRAKQNAFEKRKKKKRKRCTIIIIYNVLLFLFVFVLS